MAEIAAPAPAPAPAPLSTDASEGARPKKVSEHLSDLRDRLPEKMRDPRHWADDAEVLIREHPFKTMAGVFVGGLAVGYLLRGRR